MGLQMKLQLPIIVLITILVAATGFVSYREASKSLETAVLNDMRGESESSVRAIQTSIKGALDSLHREAASSVLLDFLKDDPYDPVNGRKMSENLAMIVKTNHLFDRIIIADAQGKIIATGPVAQLGETYPADREYFRKAMAGEEVVTQPYMSPELKAGVITVAQPLNVDGKRVGVIAVSIPMQGLFEDILEPIRVADSGYAFGVAGNGVLVMHRDKGMLFKEGLSTSADYRKMMQEGAGHFSSIGPDGKERLVVFRQDEMTKTTIGIQAPADEIYSALGSLRNMSIILVIGAILVGAVILFFLVRPVIRALQRGLTFAQDIASGKLDGELLVNNKDETGKLADALREIPKVLKNIVASYGELEKSVESGYLKTRADEKAFSGEFSTLVRGTNSIMDRFDMVLNSIPSPVVILDKNLKASYLNSTAASIAGADYTGKTCEELFGREDYNTERCALRRSTETLKPASGETRAHPRGKALDVAYTSIPMLDNSGKLAAVLQLITDLTDIKRTQNTIIEVANQAMSISDRVAAASEELSTQVEQVTRGADVQRDRVSTTATSMEEMNSTVLEVAKNAGEASEQAEGTRGKAQEGVDLVDKVITGINDVNTVAQEVHTNMLSLGEQAEAIGGVMNVISDIADQTNLLALNAAIEAARAGEAGRGFAVVADEVRKLAEKTMSATTEVGSSIKGIQTSTTMNIERVSKAAKGVELATELASTSGQALHEILTLAGRNSSLIAGIATAAEQQSATSEEISKAIEEINSIADDTASGMEQASTSVQELTVMSQELRELLAKLRA